ncbi:unnamed protein product [Prunus armeniaca]|uniref:RPW8 domain-containing protein n=1 Tax=Prunus armeniaca TaxID=36596 RepID=A0A6J5UUD0_PRUAR|nr:unnamed protein product [Prunus armeniaca]
MALELVEGAVLGTVFAALHDVVKVALVQTPPWRSQLQEARDVKEALLLARKIHDKQDELDKKLSDLLKVQQEAGLRAHEELNGREFSRSNNSQTTGQKRIKGNGVQRIALGAVFGLLFGAVIQVKDKTKMFKRILGYLNSTLDSLKPLIEEITEYNKVLHLPKEELENFTIQMETGVELIHKCSKLARDVRESLVFVSNTEIVIKQIEESGNKGC